jgi:hypothetical protein
MGSIFSASPFQIFASLGERLRGNAMLLSDMGESSDHLTQAKPPALGSPLPGAQWLVEILVNNIELRPSDS